MLRRRAGFGDELVDEICHGVWAFHLGVVQDTGDDVETTIRQHGMRRMCVVDGDDPVFVAADDQCGQVRGIVQPVERADRLAAVVDDRTQRTQECLPALSIRKRRLRSPCLAEPTDLAVGCLEPAQGVAGRYDGT